MNYVGRQLFCYFNSLHVLFWLGVIAVGSMVDFTFPYVLLLYSYVRWRFGVAVTRWS